MCYISWSFLLFDQYLAYKLNQKHLVESDSTEAGLINSHFHFLVGIMFHQIVKIPGKKLSSALQSIKVNQMFDPKAHHYVSINCHLIQMSNRYHHLVAESCFHAEYQLISFQ